MIIVLIILALCCYPQCKFEIYAASAAACPTVKASGTGSLSGGSIFLILYADGLL